MQKVTSKPLPPRLSLLTFRHFETRPRNPLVHDFRQRENKCRLRKYLAMFRLALRSAHTSAPNPHCRFNSELPPHGIRNPRCSSRSNDCLPLGSRTPVTKFSNSRDYRFFSPLSAEWPRCLGSLAKPSRGEPSGGRVSLELLSSSARLRCSRIRPHCYGRFLQAGASVTARNRTCEAGA